MSLHSAIQFGKCHQREKPFSSVSASYSPRLLHLLVGESAETTISLKSCKEVVLVKNVQEDDDEKNVGATEDSISYLYETVCSRDFHPLILLGRLFPK